MLRDYFRCVWLGVLHNKAATFINVGGLTLGLTVFFALTFYVRQEFSYDAHWEDADRIYRLSGMQETPTGNAPRFIAAPYVLGTSLRNLSPAACETYVRVFQTQRSAVVGEREFSGRLITYAEPALLDLLQLETVAGSLKDVFADPRSIALSVAAAETYFGKESPLGQTITFSSQPGDKTDYLIRAVFFVPEPSGFSGIQALALLDAAAPPVQNAGLDIWSVQPTLAPLYVDHYFKLREGYDAGLPVADLRRFMDENRYMESNQSKTRFTFQNLQDAHLRPSPFSASDNIRRLWVFEAIGMLVLLISGCNFVTLATLRSVDRMREVGLRKTVGGQAGQLVQQYLLDAFCQTLLAAILAIALLKLMLPTLQAKLQLRLAFELLDWGNLGLCLVIVVGFTLVSGAYPALLMSQGRPAALLRNNSGAQVASGNTLRRLLVAVQFVIVIVLLLASGVLQQQIQYTQNRDRGFSLENVLAMRLNSAEIIAKAPALVTEFRQLPGVEIAAAGAVSPGTFSGSEPAQLKSVAPDGSVTTAPVQQGTVGGDYFRTLSVPILAGREFSVEIDGAVPASQDPATQPDERITLLNFSAARALGFTTPDMAVERRLEGEFPVQDGETRKVSFRVIGVVADTQFSSVMLPPVAQFYLLTPRITFLAVKLAPEADAAVVTDAMNTVWTSVVGDMPLPLLPPELINGNTMAREKFEARVVIGSAAFAMVIALLGLYGLVAATVVKRVKEIGVRKVMGADRITIVSLLLWQFSKPVLVANLVAWPLGFWAIMQWLQRFPYQLDTQLIVLSGLAASLVALVIAWLTVGFMAANAASVKPVLALRYE